MAHEPAFAPANFLPYLLNQAAEAASASFQKHYRDGHGMLRTEWQVLFHLGSYGDMTASRICTLASLHKTKVSRAVHALEAKRYLRRSTVPSDRRHEVLSLTPSGLRAFTSLLAAAQDHDAQLARTLSAQEGAVLRSALRKLARLDDADPATGRHETGY